MSDEGAATGKSLLTPFNVIAGIIVILGLIVTGLRFTGGLGAVTNLSDYNPWGIWIGFDLLVGVALAAGGFVTSAAVYIFGMKKYHAAVRPAILTGFLGYALVVIALNYDVGRPWRLPYPFIIQQGTTSVLFSTHVVEDVAVACQRVVVLARGRLAFDGDPTQLADHARGKVWEVRLLAEERAALPDSLRIVDEVPEAAGTVRLRILADALPHAAATPVEPTLEDGYFVLAGSRRESKEAAA